MLILFLFFTILLKARKIFEFNNKLIFEINNIIKIKLYLKVKIFYFQSEL